MDLNLLKHEANIKSDLELSHDLGVCLKTIKNWKKKGTPIVVRKYLELKSGKLNHIDDVWKEFRINEECIEDNEGNFIYPYEIKAMNYLYMCSNITRSELNNIYINNNKFINIIPERLRRQKNKRPEQPLRGSLFGRL